LAAGLLHVPCNNFSLDHILDTAVMVGVVPDRFAGIVNTPELRRRVLNVRRPASH